MNFNVYILDQIIELLKSQTIRHDKVTNLVILNENTEKLEKIAKDMNACCIIL